MAETNDPPSYRPPPCFLSVLFSLLLLPCLPLSSSPSSGLCHVLVSLALLFHVMVRQQTVPGGPVSVTLSGAPPGCDRRRRVPIASAHLRCPSTNHHPPKPTPSHNSQAMLNTVSPVIFSILAHPSGSPIIPDAGGQRKTAALTNTSPRLPAVAVCLLPSLASSSCVALPPCQAWTKSPEEALAFYSSSAETGLAEKQVKENAAAYGLNRALSLPPSLRSSCFDEASLLTDALSFSRCHRAARGAGDLPLQADPRPV